MSHPQSRYLYLVVTAVSLASSNLRHEGIGPELRVDSGGIGSRNRIDPSRCRDCMPDVEKLENDSAIALQIRCEDPFQIAIALECHT